MSRNPKNILKGHRVDPESCVEHRHRLPDDASKPGVFQLINSSSQKSPSKDQCSYAFSGKPVENPEASAYD